MNRRSLAILMVEDNPMDVELTLRALRKHKVSNPMTVARDGEEALDYVHRRGRFAAHAPIPSLILLDIRLPKRDGIEVLREIKGHPVYRTVPVVMLTTSQEEADVRTSYELGANSYIVKPVDFDKFLEVVRQIDLYWLLTNLPPVAAARLRDLSAPGELDSTTAGSDALQEPLSQEDA
ncbi:MAG: two-component system response regulator [Candidatus Methylomirabilota bacterium]|nr:MAG: two-component system response regulator [candidate division NC10 bacterium]